MVDKARLWTSYAWMRKKYYVEHLNEQQIAKLANTSQNTVNLWLHKHGLKKK